MFLFYLFYRLCYNSIMKSVLFTTIKKQFAKNEVFFIEDIHEKSMTKTAIKEGLVRLVQEGVLKRYSYGIYYLPGEGEPDASEAINMRYIERNGKVFGFYTGEGFISVLNNKNPSIQEKIEIMTNRATSGKKSIYAFSKRFTLRKPYYPVDKNNYALNAFLSYIAMTPLNKIMENYSVLANYIKKNHLSAPEVMEMAVHFPAKTASKLLSSDLYRSLWKH